MLWLFFVSEGKRQISWRLAQEHGMRKNTIEFSNGLKVNDNLRYTLKPIRQVLKEHEDEMLAKLKLAEAQRKLIRRSQKRDRSRSPL